MSYVSKSLFIATILFTSTSPSMLFSQEPSPVETGNVAEVHDSLSTEPTSILIMRPEFDSLRTMAAAIVARNKHIRIQEPGAASGEPKQLEAELWLQPEVPNEIVEKIIGDVAKFGIVRIQLFLPFHDPDNTVVITAPADTPQRTIKDLQGKLALPEGFKCVIQIRDNDPSASITLPQEIQSQITQLEVELGIQKLQLGTEHPTVKTLEEKLGALRKAVEVASKPPVMAVPPRDAKADELVSTTSVPLQEGIQSQITQLEVDLAVQKLQLGEEHPTVKSLEEKIATLRNVDVNEPFKSRIAALESDIVLLKEFGSLVDQYNELMKERRFAEAEIIAKKARELMKDEPAALLMIEKAKLLRQIYFNSNANVRGDGGSIGMEAPANIPITTLKLQHAKATDVAEKFKQLDLGPADAIVVDERTNSLMVRGTERQIKDIEQLIEVHDAEVSPTGHGQAAQATTTATGPTTDGASPLGRGGFGRSSPRAETPIAEYRRRLNDLEKPVLELAEKVRTAETSLGKERPEYQKLLADLRAIVQQTFAARQEIQRGELAEFTRRLERMKQAIEIREKIADKIVDRRIEELLHPETDWNAVSSLPRGASRSGVASSPLRFGTDSANGKLISFLGTWEVEELNIKSAGVDISAVAPKPRLTVTENHFVVPMDGGITVTMKYELVAGDPLRVNLTFDGSNAQTFGIIKYTDDSFWLCFREPADIGQPDLTENNRPIDFLPGEQNYFLKCQRTLPVNQPEVGTFLDLERTPPVAITRTYHVGNYVTATFFEQAIGTQRTAASLDAAAEKIRQKAEELIIQVSSHNKPAAISFDSARLQLVVSHTAEGHRALSELFATLKLPMQQELTFSRCEVNEQIYTAFKDSPVWTAFDEFRTEVEDGGWIGVRKKEFVTWFERVLKESPAGEDFGQPRSLALTAGVPYQFDAGEIRVALTARINPASQKPELRIDYADLSGRPSGTRMISDLEDLAVWIPSSEGSITFLVHQSGQGGSFPRRDSLQKQVSAPLKPIDMALEVTKEEPRLVQIRLTSGVEGSLTTVSCSVGVPMEFCFAYGRTLYQLTFERNGSNANSQAWLNNNAVPVEFLADDQERAATGQLVTKVIYLNPDSGAVETISGHSVEAGVDPVSVAAEKGTVIGVIRISKGSTQR